MICTIKRQVNLCSLQKYPMKANSMTSVELGTNSPDTERCPEHWTSVFDFAVGFFDIWVLFISGLWRMQPAHSVQPKCTGWWPWLPFCWSQCCSVLVDLSHLKTAKPPVCVCVCVCVCVRVGVFVLLAQLVLPLQSHTHSNNTSFQCLSRRHVADKLQCAHKKRIAFPYFSCKWVCVSVSVEATLMRTTTPMRHVCAGLLPLCPSLDCKREWVCSCVYVKDTEMGTEEIWYILSTILSYVLVYMWEIHIACTFRGWLFHGLTGSFDE